MDANAIAPDRVLRIGQIIQAAGGQKETSLGKETPEKRDRNRSLNQVIATLSDEGQ